MTASEREALVRARQRIANDLRGQYGINKTTINKDPDIILIDAVLSAPAAPDLLACLKEMLDAFVPTTKSQFRLTQAQGGAAINARAAIAKAEGGKP